jgi:predicted nuclease with TOPRIM domain
MEFAFEDDSDSLANLEARILKSVEIISTLRDENASLRNQLQAAIEEKERVSKDTKDASSRAEKVMAELESLRNERAQVRTRIEKLLGQMDLLSSS